MIGITAYGAYLPRLRLDRGTIYRQMGWLAPATLLAAQGRRTMCNWDEDAVTMAVAACRDCLTGADPQAVDGLYLASTSLPFADRQNAGIVAAALDLPEHIPTADLTASQKAGSTALLTALETLAGGARRQVLVAAADRRETRPGGFYELWYGDGAAALMVGCQDVIAAFEGSHSLSCDMVDHYRSADNRFDTVWEERWSRDEGYGKIIPETVAGLLDRLGLTAEAVDWLAYPCFFSAEHRRIAARIGVLPERVIDNLHDGCGDTGTAHCLLMLTAALERAQPGQRIVVAGYGQGCNAISFTVTDAIANLTPRNGLSGALEGGRTCDNYTKWLTFRGLIEPDMGIRAEAPSRTALSTLWRHRRMLLGLVGGRCRDCGTPQFPKTPVCVNPDCGAHHSQEDYRFADRPARIKTFTGDLLAVSLDPPHKYGMIQFDDGGRFMADFTDCDFEDLSVGRTVKMVFRRRGTDAASGFVNYFWKAVPQAEPNGGPSDAIRLDGRVAVVTGAGAGLGRAYALELAARGAAVLVNDLGSTPDGRGRPTASAAEAVAAKITAAGGRAVANTDSVATAEGGRAIVRAALDAFGRLDILVNNAGFLRDKSFSKLTADDWQAVLDVHLNAAFYVTAPAFAAMREAGYGRIVFTTSASGLYGNFGQTNYAAAKMGLLGLMHTLKLEGARHGIKVNTVAPIAASRLTETIMPPEMLDRAQPEKVAAMVVYLCSDQCSDSGHIYHAGMDHYSRAAVVTAPPTAVGGGSRPPSVEEIAASFDRIDSLEGAVELDDATTALVALLSPQSPSPGDGAAATDASPSEGLQALFDRLAGTFDARAAEGVAAVFQFDITGSGDGRWQVVVQDNACRVTPDGDETPDCTLRLSAEDFTALVEGRLQPMQAFMSGKLSIAGDVGRSQLIQRLFKLGG